MNVNAQKFQSSMSRCVNHRHGATIGRHSLSQPLRAASSLREGAGNGCVPFNVPPGNRNGAGDFHRPYETQKIMGFTIHRSTLPQSATLTAPSEREPGGVRTIQSGACETGGVRAIFIAPTKLREFYISPFIRANFAKKQTLLMKSVCFLST